MNQYIYFGLGIILGLSIAVYYFLSRDEKIENRIKLDQMIYSTKKLDVTMEKIVNRINLVANEKKRQLTEDEKNDIIVQCYKDNFKLNI